MHDSINSSISSLITNQLSIIHISYIRVSRLNDKKSLTPSYSILNFMLTKIILFQLWQTSIIESNSNSHSKLLQYRHSILFIFHIYFYIKNSPFLNYFFYQLFRTYLFTTFHSKFIIQTFLANQDKIFYLSSLYTTFCLK